MPAPTTADPVAEFYRELGLLVRAGLPLPDAILGVAQGSSDRRLRLALAAVSEEVAQGGALSEALARHRRWFPKLHTALIRGGETSGALPEVLHEAATLARFTSHVAVQFKEIAAYPLLTAGFAVTLLLVLLRYYLPQFGRDIQAVTELPLVGLPACLFGLADWVVSCWPGVVAAYVAVIALLVWLAAETLTSRRALQRILGNCPGTASVMVNLDMARVCGTWAVLLRRGTPLDAIAAVSAGMTVDDHLAERLRALGEQCKTGTALPDATVAAHLPQPLALVLRHTSEDGLADELAAMQEHCVERAQTAARRAAVWWQILTFAGMAVVAGSVILSLFTPMIQLYERMGAPAS